jgi:hypothetical protein
MTPFLSSVDDGEYALWDTQIAETWVWDQMSNRNDADPVFFYSGSRRTHPHH